MPIHEFECRSCDYKFELLIMTKDEIDSARCPKCQSPEVGKLMSAASVCVKGTASGRETPHQSPVQSHTCGSDSCTAINLPGHTK
jgi:putative FmdB family regulatory protein